MIDFARIALGLDMTRAERLSLLGFYALAVITLAPWVRVFVIVCHILQGT